MQRHTIITIHVTDGHNGGSDGVDEIAKDMVEALIDCGHNVTAATLVVGGEYDILDYFEGNDISLQGHDPFFDDEDEHALGC